MDKVREKVAEWQKQGAVIRLASPAWCTSPLSVVEKLDTQSGTVKKRVVLDLSRHVNKPVKKWNVQMEDLRATEGMREEGDWMAVFDLENQFFHVKLRPDAYGYILRVLRAGRRWHRQVLLFHCDGLRFCKSKIGSRQIWTANLLNHSIKFYGNMEKD